MATTASAIGRPQGDDGHADPNVTSALAAWAQSAASEREALAPLSSARLLVPVVAMLAETTVPPGGDAPPSTPREAGAEKESEMAIPTLVGNDGRVAIIAFTGIEALRRWRPDARPVPTPAARVWHAAVTEGQAVVIDVAGPVPFVVEGARLAALASGEAPPPPHEDPDVLRVVQAVVAAEPGVTGAALGPGRAGGDLEVSFWTGDAEAARRAAQAVAMSLAARFRRGVEVSVSSRPR
jgi:hypothetical protein